MDTVVIEFAQGKACEPVRDIVMSGKGTTKMLTVRFNSETGFITSVA